MFHLYHRQAIQYLSQSAPLAVEGVGEEDDRQAAVGEVLGEEFFVAAELHS